MLMSLLLDTSESRLNFVVLILSFVTLKLLQGFSRDIKLSRQAYLGYIKDYEGATLMEVSCVL